MYCPAKILYQILLCRSSDDDNPFKCSMSEREQKRWCKSLYIQNDNLNFIEKCYI